MEARDLFFFPFPYGATEKGTRRISKKNRDGFGAREHTSGRVGGQRSYDYNNCFRFLLRNHFPAKNLRLKFARPSNSRAAISSSQTHLQYREGICNVTYTLNKGRRQFASRTHQVFKMYILKKGN